MDGLVAKEMKRYIMARKRVPLRRVGPCVYCLGSDQQLHLEMMSGELFGAWRTHACREWDWARWLTRLDSLVCAVREPWGYVLFRAFVDRLWLPQHGATPSPRASSDDARSANGTLEAAPGNGAGEGAGDGATTGTDPLADVVSRLAAPRAASDHTAAPTTAVGRGPPRRRQQRQSVAALSMAKSVATVLARPDRSRRQGQHRQRTKGPNVGAKIVGRPLFQ